MRKSVSVQQKLFASTFSHRSHRLGILHHMDPFLTLYLSVHRGDVEGINFMKRVPFRYTGTDWKCGYIGLRGTQEAAMERVTGKFGMEESQFVVLKVEFSKAGFCKYGKAIGGEDRRHAQVLSRQVYYKGENKDWGVWHFNAELPLQEETHDEGWLILCTWMIEESVVASAGMDA